MEDCVEPALGHAPVQAGVVQARVQQPLEGGRQVLTVQRNPRRALGVADGASQALARERV